MAESRIDQSNRPAARPVPSGSAAPVTRAPERRPAVRPAPPASPAPVVGNGRPDDPAELRREIEETRARMSSTLDSLEARVVYEKQELERKKDELWAKLTFQGFRQTMAREPWRTMAIGFAAGYVVAAILD